jgi:hypothetical protein
MAAVLAQPITTTDLLQPITDAFCDVFDMQKELLSHWVIGSLN